jgi:hypothetical protein
MNTKQIWLIVGGIALVAILAAAAYFGAQMLNAPQGASAAAEGGISGQRVMEIAVDDGSGRRMARITFEPAPELPDRPPEAAGVFTRKEDNSYFVGTGNIELSVEVVNGVRSVNLSNDGPEVEVVVTRDTMLYEEVTEHPTPDQFPESGEMVIPQELQPLDSLPEDLGNNVELQVWGEQSGDRIIAGVFVFRVVRDG